MADTVIVGRVAIRVLPDTDKFKEQLRADLEKETAGVDATVPVEAEAQTEQMEEDLKAKVKEIEERLKVKLKSQVDGISSRVRELTKQAELQSQADPITLKTEMDEDIAKGLRRGLREAVMRGVARELTAAFNKGIKVNPDMMAGLVHQFEVAFEGAQIKPDTKKLVNSAKPTGKAFWQKFNKSFPARDFVAETSHTLKSGKRIIIPVRYDGSLTDYLKQQFIATRKADLAHSTVGVLVNAQVSERSLIETRAEMELWFKRLKVITVKVKTVLDKRSVKAVTTGLAALSGGRLFKKLVSLEPFKRLDEQLPKLALMATALGQSANYLISMSSDTLSLARSIGQIGPAALALPGIFTGAAISMIAFTTAMASMKKEAPKVIAQWDKLKTSVGKSFWEKAERPIHRFLADMTSGFKQTGGSIGGFLKKVLGSVHDIVAPKLPTYFNALSEAFGTIADHAPAIANIVKHFGDLGAVATPKLAQWMADMTEKFSAWLDLKSKSGDLQKMIDTATVRMRQLWDVVAGTWGLLGGLSKAADKAGGATLGSLGTAMRHLSDVVNDESFQKRLVNVFASARIAIERMNAEAGPAVKKLFRDIGDNADKLLPKVGTAMGKLAGGLATILDQPAVGGGLVYFFDSLNSTLDKLAPSLALVSNGLAGILRVMGTMLTSFEPIIEIAIGALQSHATGLLRSVEKMVRSLSAGLTNFMRSLLPAIDKLAPAVLRVAESLGESFGATLTALGPIVAAALGALANVLTAFSHLPGPIQVAVASFVAFKVATGGWKSVAAFIIAKLGAIGKAMLRMHGPIGVTSRKLTRFGMNAKSSIGKIAGAAGKLTAAAVAIAAIGNALGNSADTAGANELALAMEKVKSSADMSGLEQMVSKSTWIDKWKGNVDNVTAGFDNLYKSAHQWDGGSGARVLDSLTSFFGAGKVSAAGQFADVLKQWDDTLASMQSTDAAGAQRIFDSIIERGTKAGYKIEELKALFPEYSSAVELAAGKASGAFGTSADDIKTKAAEVQQTIETEFSKMDGRINALRGKAQTRAIKSYLKGQTSFINAVTPKLPEGFGKDMTTQAKTLIGKINTTMDGIATAKDKKTRDKLKAKRDELLAEYKDRFGNLPQLLADESGDGTLSAAIAQLVGSGVPAGAQDTIKASITTPVNAGVEEAKLKIAELPTAITALDLTGKVNAAFAEAQSAIATNTGALQLAFTTAATTITASAGDLAANVAGPATSAAQAVITAAQTAMDTLLSGFKTKVGIIESDVNVMVTNIKIAVAFSLFSSGQSVSESFARGIRDKISDVESAADAMAKAVKDRTPHSPAKKGPLSGKGYTLFSGAKAASDFAKGIRSEIGSVESAMDQVTSVVAGADFSTAINRAASSATQVKALSSFELAPTQNVYQIGDVRVDVSELDGIRTVDSLAKTLRRKKRQAGGK